MSAVSATTSAGPSSLSTVPPIGIDLGSSTLILNPSSAAPTGVPGVGQDYTDTSTSSTFILSSIGAPSQGGGDATGVLTIQTSPPEQVTATTAGTGGGGVVATPARTATMVATSSTSRTSTTGRSSARSSGSSIITAGTSNRPAANSSSAAGAMAARAGGSKAKVLALGVVGISFLLGAVALH